MAFVVVGVGADPFPNKLVANETSHRAIVVADAHGPIWLADGLKVKRRMKRVCLPESVVLAGDGAHFGWLRLVEPPKLQRAAARDSHDLSKMSSSGLVWPEP